MCCPPPTGRYNIGQPSEVLVEIPEAAGVDVYVFGGPTMRQAVQRYNLFSGGGPLAAALGPRRVVPRRKTIIHQEDVCGWRGNSARTGSPVTSSGSSPAGRPTRIRARLCGADHFPDPAAMIRQLSAEHYRLNLWEHAFTHPILADPRGADRHSGDYEVWGGLVPDFLDPEARRIFAGFHDKEHVAIGVSGYKLDECDNSDFTGNWSCPEIATFPFGRRWRADAFACSACDIRTQSRASSSDASNARTDSCVPRERWRRRIRTCSTATSTITGNSFGHSSIAGSPGCCGRPKCAMPRSAEDLVRRLQTVVLSPMALINAWYIKNPPWKQIEREANNAERIAPQWKDRGGHVPAG